MEPLSETVGSVCTSEQAPKGRRKMPIKAQSLPDSPRLLSYSASRPRLSYLTSIASRGHFSQPILGRSPAPGRDVLIYTCFRRPDYVFPWAACCLGC